MKPILFAKTETVFTSNGLGRLSDCFSAVVSEERNGAFELELEYPITGIHYDEIEIGSIIGAKPADGKSIQPFEVYKITKPLNGVVKIYAEHISYRLNRIPVLPYSAQNCLLALQGLKTNAAEPCPFDFYTDKLIDGEWVNPSPASIRERLGGTEGSILERFQGEYEFDCWDVHLWTHRGTDNGVVIRYGKNLTELEQETRIDETITGVLPFYQNEDVQIIGDVQYSANANNFPYHRTVVIDFSQEFQTEYGDNTPPTKAELEQAAVDYIDRNGIGVPSVNLKISFVALWQTEEYRNLAALERVNLCDTVTVQFDKLGVSATAQVIKTKFDVLLERYDSIEVGDPVNNLSTAISSVSDTVAETVMNNSVGMIQARIDNAADTLAGGLGGHVVINRNADGKPNEILIMDTDDKTTAVNVIRMNSAGIGFSQNGYNGTYNSAWLIDGTLDMSQINVINLTANLIRGGVLQLGTLDNMAGVLQVYDDQNTLIGQLDKDGLKMWGQDGSYVVMNNAVGFSGYDRLGNRLYWVDGQEFHQKRSVIEEEITLCNMMRFIPITLYDNDQNITNQGIALVSAKEVI